MSAALKLIHSNFPDAGKKDYINKFRQNEPKTGVFFIDFIRDTAGRKARRMGETYKRNYETVIRHIEQFSNLFDVNI